VPGDPAGQPDRCGHGRPRRRRRCRAHAGAARPRWPRSAAGCSCLAHRAGGGVELRGPCAAAGPHPRPVGAARHRVDPRMRWERALAALRPGEALGLVWNRQVWSGHPLRPSSTRPPAATLRSGSIVTVAPIPGPATASTTTGPGSGPIRSLRRPPVASGRPGSAATTAASCAWLPSQSDHRRLGARRWQRRSDAVAWVLDWAGAASSCPFARRRTTSTGRLIRAAARRRRSGDRPRGRTPPVRRARGRDGGRRSSAGATGGHRTVRSAGAPTPPAAWFGCGPRRWRRRRPRSAPRRRREAASPPGGRDRGRRRTCRRR